MKGLSAVGLVLTVDLKRLIFLTIQIFYSKLQRNDVESGDIPNKLALDRNFTEKMLAQTTLILGLLFMREISHVTTRFSKNSQKFDILPFYVTNKYGKLIENWLKARELLKLGNVPQVERLELTGKHQSFQLWSDFKTGTEKLLSDQTFHGFKLLLTSERRRVTRSESSFGSEPSGYPALVETCFGKFANYIDVLTFNLAYRLVPWSQWVRLSDDCFNLCSEMSDEQRKISLEEPMQEKFGPVPLMNDDKTCIHAEYVRLLVRQTATLDTEEF